MDLYTRNALDCSKKTTLNYSTSFSMGVRMLGKDLRDPVYAIYGFVRFADEIVDTFHDQDKKELINRFQAETFEAIERKFSNNPILHSFQWVVINYGIDHALIKAFLKSMRMDLCPSGMNYTQKGYSSYIYGSAEVVGLMCLRVFCADNDEYESLVQPARKLGEAFQKVNFLRDIKSDLEERGRFYFPDVDFHQFDDQAKREIEADIQKDFDEAVEGIKKLPDGAKLGVYLAYVYYLQLFNRIKRASAKSILNKRYRIDNSRKVLLLFKTYSKVKLGWI